MLCLINLQKRITSEFEAKESKGRARSGNKQDNFEYAVRFILEGLWRRLQHNEHHAEPSNTY